MNEVLKNSYVRPLVVQFTAEWCQPCKVMKPAVRKAVDGRSDVELALVDVDRDVNPQDLIKYRIRGIPTILLFIDGEPVSKYNSFPSEHLVNKWLDKVL